MFNSKTDVIILETTRLVLKLWTRDDADDLFEILKDEDVVRYIADGKPFSYEKTLEFINWAESYQRENGFSRWKVIDKFSSQTIGSCGFARPHGILEIELGYLLAKECWGKGYASEIVQATLQYGFEKLGFTEVIAMTDLPNYASQRVLEKIGFIKRGLETINNEESLVYLAKTVRPIAI